LWYYKKNKQYIEEKKGGFRLLFEIEI